MELTDYLTPVSSNVYNVSEEKIAGTFGESVHVYAEGKNFPSLKKIHLAIVGVKEDRSAGINAGCCESVEVVRMQLYNLFKGNYDIKIADLGNINKGFSIEDTYFAVRSVVHELLKKKIIPIVIGGSEDLMYPLYLAYENIESTINITSIDSTIDIGNSESELNSKTWLGKIVLHQPNHLFNYSNIGYQTYLTNQHAINLLEKLFFDAKRLGVSRGQIEETEPAIRNADLVSIDISSVKSVDAPGQATSQPNGFVSDEICRLARYAGMSDKLSTFGIFEYNPKLDRRGLTASLIAQIIWCFVDGYYNRKNDYPFKKTTDYTKYIVNSKEFNNDLVFYKSKKSDRWWIEVPFPADKKTKYERHILVPCSYSTYNTALSEELPDEWWQTYQKLSF